MLRLDRTPRKAGKIRSRLGDPVPTLDGFGASWTRADIEGSGTDQLAEPLLLHDVCAPACGATAGEHGGHHLCRHPGEVQYHRRPELDVCFDRTVGAAFP